jgi:hypothetical protein
MHRPGGKADLSKHLPPVLHRNRDDCSLRGTGILQARNQRQPGANITRWVKLQEQEENQVPRGKAHVDFNPVEKVFSNVARGSESVK